MTHPEFWNKKLIPYYCCRVFTDAAVLWSLWRFLRASSDLGVATGCRVNAGERHGSEETAVILGIVLLALLAGRGLEPSKAQTARAAERQNISLYLSFSLVCG